MFKDCTALSAAPVLPATTLSPYCYNMMFGGCVSLTEIPELTATELAESCYESMFRGCTGLTKVTIPKIPVVSRCYNRMFLNCANLSDVTVKVEKYDTGLYPFTEWLEGAASQGTIHIRAGLDKTQKKCLYYPDGWTVLEDVVD